MLLLCVLDAVRVAAEDAVPWEACGLIDSNGNLIKCENVAKNRATQFRISPEEFKRKSRNKEIVGVYHSHVDGGAYISVLDREGMTLAGGGLYVVASVVNGVGKEVKVWNYKDGNFTPVAIPGRGNGNGKQT